MLCSWVCLLLFDFLFWVHASLYACTLEPARGFDCDIRPESPSQNTEVIESKISSRSRVDGQRDLFSCTQVRTLFWSTLRLFPLQTQEGTTARFATVCFDCPGWNECSDCNITKSTVTPECDAPFEHSSADRVGVTLETLSIEKGYWRATNESDSILACYNVDACYGGQTGSDSFCAPGYKGPCTGGCSSPRACYVVVVM